MKRALMYASVASMIQQFNMENIRLLLELGYEVDVACNMEKGSTITDERVAQMRTELEEMGVRVMHIPVSRKISQVGDIATSFIQTRKLIKENRYDLIHCHSPIGGMICRLANRVSGCYEKNRMIYTAHGFHFYKGAPIANWLLFYPIEWICSCFTDILLTINEEDYKLAQGKMKAGETVLTPGVGIYTGKFEKVEIDRSEKRRALGIPENAFVAISVGELNRNKNHSVVIRAIGRLKNADIHYMIAGRGAEKSMLESLAMELGVSDQIHLLGYRTDVNELYSCADICIFPSIREGQGLAALEGMAAGLPLVCADNRGTRSYAEDGITGYVYHPGDATGFSEGIHALYSDPVRCEEMGKRNAQRSKQYDIETVSQQMKEIYSDVT